MQKFKVEVNRLVKIGIDRVVFNGFKVLEDKENEKFLKTRILEKDKYSEKMKWNENGIKLEVSKVKKENDVENENVKLEFNPNKIMEKHNIYNSDLNTLEKAIEIVVETLKTHGITLDLSQAKIKEIELNLNLPLNVDKLEEVLDMLGSANSKRALCIKSAKGLSTRDIDKIRTFYINSVKSTEKTIKIYDKTLEVFMKDRIKTDIPITRIEVLFGRDYYRRVLTKLGKTNKLSELMKMNEEFLKKIFREALLKEISSNGEKKIRKMKRSLKEEIISFRSTEKKKRKKREQLKKAGKEIPEIYKQERGVFKYLEKTCWIFDYSFLIELVNNHMEKKHISTYVKQIVKKYLKNNNYEKYQALKKLIFEDLKESDIHQNILIKSELES